MALAALLQGGTQSSLELALREQELSARDRALLTQLVYGTVKMQRALDATLKPLLRRPFASLSPELQWVLRMGAFQLLYLEKIPVHSAVDESVKLARRTGHAGTAAVANAVLRKLARQGSRLARPLETDPLSAFADYASMPDWLAAHFIARFGFDMAVRIADGVNRPARRAVRVNTAIAPADELTHALEQAGVTVQPSRYGIASCLILVSTPPSAVTLINRMIGSGRLTVQSEESQLAVEILDPRPGERILDVCAGRGVKTGAIAERGPELLVALDDDATKLAALAQQMVRLNMSAVETLQADATKPYSGPRADAVLVDAPCTGIGTIGRRADLRWHKMETDAARLAFVQQAMLEQSSQAVKPGGRLLYVTCSTDSRENEAVVGAFLASHHEFVPGKIQFAAPPGSVVRNDFAALTVPGLDGADGFFYALLERREPQASSAPSV